MHTDKVIQTEILLNIINTLFGKAVWMKRDDEVVQLHQLRRSIYYGEYDWDAVSKSIQAISVKLNDV